MTYEELVAAVTQAMVDYKDWSERHLAAIGPLMKERKSLVIRRRLAIGPLPTKTKTDTTQDFINKIQARNALALPYNEEMKALKAQMRQIEIDDPKPMTGDELIETWVKGDARKWIVVANAALERYSALSQGKAA